MSEQRNGLRRGMLAAALGGLAAAGGVTAGLSLGTGLGRDHGELRIRAGEVLAHQLAAAREIERHDEHAGCTVTLELAAGALPRDAAGDTVQVVVSAYTQMALDSIEQGGTLGRLDIRAVASQRSAASLRISPLHTATVPGVPCAAIARFGALVMEVLPGEPHPRPVLPPDEGPPPPVIA